jgi:hypothetical protein
VSRARFLVYASAQPLSEDGHPWYRWRLVSANNRPLGESPLFHDDLPSCRRAIIETKERAGEDQLHLLSDPHTGLWTWELCDRSTSRVFAASARSYQRQRECRQNAQVFRDVAPGAEMSTELLIVPTTRRLLAMPRAQARRGLSLV